MTKTNGSGSLESLSDTAFEIARRRQAAALAVVDLLEGHFEGTFQSDAGKELRAAAWLAGTSLFRSFGLPGKEPPGTPVLSDKSNQEGPKLMKVFLYLLEKDGIKLEPGDLTSAVPPEGEPRMSIVSVQEQFQDRYNEIMKQHRFDYAEGARTGAVACARLVKLHCLNRKDIEAGTAARIVATGFVEGAKTAPAALKD